MYKSSEILNLQKSHATLTCIELKLPHFSVIFQNVSRTSATLYANTCVKYKMCIKFLIKYSLHAHNFINTQRTEIVHDVNMYRIEFPTPFQLYFNSYPSQK